MSAVDCRDCGERFDARATPVCPTCLARSWLACDTLIRDKHDPARIGTRWPSYRSVLTRRFVETRREVLEHAARHGRWYFDTHYENHVHVTFQPLGRSPGVGIPAGHAEPEHALDCLVVAEADREPHAFAADRAAVESQIRAGEFVPLAPCSRDGCENPRRPGRDDCAAHREARDAAAVSRASRTTSPA